MNKGDRVRHKIKGWLGVVYSLEKHGVLVDWSDETGVCFRLASLESLGLIDDPEV